MARKITRLNVFVSCTSDLAAERKLVERAIEEVNPKLQDVLGVNLSFKTWPDWFYPGFNMDAQAEMFRQMGDDYDVFVGIIGNRFGSPTLRSDSGTEEEFDKAYSRYTEDSTSVRVLFYFKKSVQDVYELDLDQLIRVRSFREKIGKLGLDREFSDSSQIYALVAQQLWDLIGREWKGDKWLRLDSDSTSQSNRSLLVSSSGAVTFPELSLPPGTTSESIRLTSAVNDFEAVASGIERDEEVQEEEQLGILDLQSEIESGFELVSDFARHMTEYLGDIGARFESRTASINSLKGPTGVISAKNAKEIVNETAGDLEWFNTVVMREIPDFKEGTRRIFSCFARFLDMQVPIAESTKVQRSPDFEQTLDGLFDSVQVARAGLAGFRQSIEGVPSLTSKFSTARKSTLRVLADLDAELTVFLNNVDQLRVHLRTTGNDQLQIVAA